MNIMMVQKKNYAAKSNKLLKLSLKYLYIKSSPAVSVGHLALLKCLILDVKQQGLFLLLVIYIYLYIYIYIYIYI